MSLIRTAIAGILALIAATSASAQQFPTVPAQTVIGRLGVPGDTGPSQAIPFATFTSRLLSSGFREGLALASVNTSTDITFYDTSPMQAGQGGRISFGGKINNTTGTLFDWAAIGAPKADSVAGNTVASLAFYLRAQGGTAWGTPQMTLSQPGVLTLGSAPAGLALGSSSPYNIRNSAGTLSVLGPLATEILTLDQLGNLTTSLSATTGSFSAVSQNTVNPFLGPIFLGETTDGGTYLVPGGSAASTPLTTKNSVWNASRTTFPFTGTAFGKTLLNTSHAGSHAGTQLFSSAVNAQIAGSGTNGPVQGDYALGLNSEKTGWQTNVGASGEIGGLYVRVRQNTATPNSGDSSGALLDVANLGNSGFLASLETISTNLSGATGLVLKQIDTQTGVIDSNSGKAYGFVAQPFAGSLDYGVYVQHPALGGTFQYPFAYANTVGDRFTIDQNSNVNIYPIDGTSSNFFTLRNNAGSFSLVNTAGSLEFLAINQAGSMSVGSISLTGSPLSAIYGGTGQTTYTLGDTLYSSAANTLSKLAGNTTSTKKFLRQTGTGSVSAAPAWDTIVAGDVPLTSAHWLIGNGSGIAVDVAMSGDTTVDNAGAVTIGNAKVSYAKIQNLGALAVMGRSANSSGVGADIQATAASDAVLRENGSTLGFGTIATGGIANNAVTLAKLATQATNTVLGNATSGSAVPTALAVGTCSTSASALNWTTNTGFGCNTSINAATLGGATFSAPGAIGGGTPSTGVFTTLTASTSLTSPLHIGGSGTTGTQLTLQTTTGIGTTDAFAFKGGNNGATTFATLQTGSFNLQTGSTYSINGTSVLSGSTLGSGVTASSLTSVGTIGTGTWQGTAVAAGFGGWGRDMTAALSTWTPTLSCGSGSLTSTSTSGSSVTVGKMIYVEIAITDTTNGTCAGTLNVTNLPVAAKRSLSQITGRSTNGLVQGFLSAASTTLQIVKYDSTYPGADGVLIGLNGWYETN